LPPRADLMPRSLSTSAIEAKLVVSAAWIARITGSTVWANSSAALTWIARCAYRKSNPAILMVQSAQDRAADDIPGPLNAAMDRGILVAFAEDYDMIHAFPSD
jgi:hypothetical protein